MVEIENELDLTSGSRTTKSNGTTTKENFKNQSLLLDFAKLVGDKGVSLVHELIQPLKHGMIAGVSNVPLSLASLSHYVDILHGGPYITASAFLPFYNPGVQAQLFWVNNAVLGNILQITSYVDITPAYTISVGIGGVVNVNVTHPFPTWIALPPGAKPEQAEAIINSTSQHRLPKLISDQEYYLAKEWTSLFFQLSLAGGVFTNFSTNIRTLAQAADKGVDVVTKAAEEIG